MMNVATNTLEHSAKSSLINPMRSPIRSNHKENQIAAADTVPGSARKLLECLNALRFGTLAIDLPDGSSRVFGQAAAQGIQAQMTVHDWSMFEDVLARGDIGFGEAYIDGVWASADLAALLTLLNRNRETLAKAIHGQWWSLLIERFRHRKNANTRAGSRRNIMAHYDLGNDFYGHWLDSTMSYSSALFEISTMSLPEAQLAKYRRIVRELGIKPGDQVLEIGCGWGGFAEVAAREAGAKVTGITLSPAQLAFARERMERAGLSEQVSLELTDYRDLPQRDEHYDFVVSIEMFEAVGERWWPTYFSTVQTMLKESGRAMIQSITIDSALFSRYRKGTDFIQQHVFPGGMLPSPEQVDLQAARAGLLTVDRHAFGRDYARTLALWQEKFNASWAEIAGTTGLNNAQKSAGLKAETQGFDERFRRLWNFYLAYCQAGFLTETTDVMQFHLVKKS